jgi:hypothetical protein
VKAEAKVTGEDAGVRIQEPDFWILDFRFWILELNLGFWIGELDFEN